MLKLSPIFKRCTFGRKQGCMKKQRLPTFEVWVFWTCNFIFICVKLWACKLAINGKYSKKNNGNPNYYASFVIFKHTKMQF
jgi:hypothetical protein